MPSLVVPPSRNSVAAYSSHPDYVANPQAQLARSELRPRPPESETPHSGRNGMYRRTVRGESVRPSFTRSSAAMRSSPQVWSFAVISAMSRCTSTGMRGRARGRDFRRQRRRKDSITVTAERATTTTRASCPPNRLSPPRSVRPRASGHIPLHARGHREKRRHRVCG